MDEDQDGQVAFLLWNICNKKKKVTLARLCFSFVFTLEFRQNTKSWRKIRRWTNSEKRRWMWRKRWCSCLGAFLCWVCMVSLCAYLSSRLQKVHFDWVLNCAEAVALKMKKKVKLYSYVCVLKKSHLRFSMDSYWLICETSLTFRWNC